MKAVTRNSFVLVIILSLFMIRATAQKVHSCCNKSSTAAFAMLSHDETFKAAHLSPLPFHYESPKGKMIKIKARDGQTCDAFEIRSDKPTDNYLFVFQEWWGLNDYIKQEAEKLQNALMNVHVIALDLYDGKVAANSDEAQKYMSEAKEERIRAIIGGAIDYAGSSANIQTIGWCFGGGWSMQATLMSGKQAEGCVMYYGMPEKDNAKLKTLTAPVLGIFASKDEWINPEVVSVFVKDMKVNGKQLTVKTYPADHAFANPSNPKYDKASAEDAHIKAVEFLKEHL